MPYTIFTVADRSFTTFCGLAGTWSLYECGSPAEQSLANKVGSGYTQPEMFYAVCERTGACLEDVMEAFARGEDGHF